MYMKIYIFNIQRSKEENHLLNCHWLQSNRCKRVAEI